MPDPYQILGVNKSAGAAEIKSAYRKLAKKYHPDVNPGRKDIEHKFKEISAAYDLLSDPAKRARYDSGEVDAQGNERGFRAGSDPFAHARGRGRSPFGNDPFGGLGAEDFFAEFFNRTRGGQRQQEPRGGDLTYSLSIPFVEACLGCKQRVTLNNRKTIDVNVPSATNDGDKLRLRGLGEQSLGGAGDAIIEIHVMPHAFFTRKDNDIYLEAPISLPEAVLGATITVPTIDGHVAIKVPKGANSGTTLRLKGKGASPLRGQAGDMFVKLKIVLPDSIPADLAEFVEKWAKKNGYDPRKKLGW